MGNFLNTSLVFSNMAKSLAVVFKAAQSKMRAYLKDFYPFDIDDSDTEYVISEMKYDTSVCSLMHFCDIYLTFFSFVPVFLTVWCVAN